MAVVNAAWARNRHNIDVRVLTEVLSIDRKRRTVLVRDVVSGATSEHEYHRLVLATGAMPNTACIEGARLPRVFTLRNLQDMDAVHAELTSIETASAPDEPSTEKKKPAAVVVGASFIGLEIAEALAKRGAATTLLELAPQVLPVMDAEMTVPLRATLEAHGVVVQTGVKPLSIAQSGQMLRVQLDGGGEIAADIVVLAVGVLPDSRLAREAGLQLGVGGSVVVDDQMHTSDPCIYACGDVVQSRNTVIDAPMVLALAGPAARQARIAAASIAGHGNERFGGVVGTAAVHCFDITACSVGASEKLLKRVNAPNVGKVYLFSATHVEWYPGATPMLLKLVFDTSNGRVLGGQIVGRTDVAKRIDVLSVAVQQGMTVRQLSQLELAYAPQFNAPKDILNVAGMVACNVIDGLVSLCYPDQLPEGAVLLDVREDAELKAQGELPGAIHIPCGQLRARLGELAPYKSRPIVAVCKVGQRGNHVTRMLKQNDFDARNLSGGMMVWQAFHNPAIWQRFLSTGIF